MEEQPAIVTGISQPVLRSSNKKILVFGAIIIFALGFLIGYVTRGIKTQNMQQSQKITSSHTVNQSKVSSIPSQSLSETSISPSVIQAQISPVPSQTIPTGQSTYVNKDYGFTMTYPKFDQTGDSCTQNPDSSYSGIVPYKVFEDPSSNSIYIALAIFAEKPEKFMPQENGYTWDPANCKIVNNSLNLIKDGYINGMPPPGNIDKPESFQIKYAKINNNDDLNNLVHSLYGKACYAQSGQLDKNLDGVYDYTLVDSNGKTDGLGDVASGAKEPLDGWCVTNFAYIFLYSPSKKLAIITSGFQNGPLSGTNNQTIPTFTFLP